MLQLTAPSPFVELATAQLHYICLRGEGQRDSQFTYQQWEGQTLLGVHCQNIYNDLSPEKTCSQMWKCTTLKCDFHCTLMTAVPPLCVCVRACVRVSVWMRPIMHAHVMWELTFVGAGLIGVCLYVCSVHTSRRVLPTPFPMPLIP